jgi:ATP-dependent DNA ligase
MLALGKRRQMLNRVIGRGKSGTLRFSHEFDDPLALLAACEKQGLEGIVSRLRDDCYRSGTNGGWITVKTATWREANRERYELFEKL